MSDTHSRLYDFIEDYGELDIKSTPKVSYYLDAIRDNFFDRVGRSPLHLSLSSFGDHLLPLTLKLLGYPPETRKLSMLDRNFLYTGHEVEARLLSLLDSLGFQVSGEQMEVEYLGLKGHIDGVLNGDTVIDVKAVKSGTFYRSLPGKNQHINEKYLAQVRAYQEAIGLQYSGLLYYNRDTSEIYFHDTSDYDLTPHIIKFNKAREVESLDELLAREEEFIPTPPPEVFKKAETGNFLLPSDIKYSGYVDAFYLTGVGLNGYGKTQNYVLDYRTHEETKEILKRWQDIYL